jgi:DNA-nicking Smr family endonuclease
MKRARVLSQEESLLWRNVTKDVSPLGAGMAPPSEAIAPDVERPVGQPAPATEPVRRRPPQPIKPLAAIERRLIRSLRKGREHADAVLDLHGLRQDAAHAALGRFLRDQQAFGARLVVIVTGKGARSTADHGAERGILRRQLPHWLHAPEMRTTVLGFEPAARRHGGDGAFYVRLRPYRESR